MPSENMETELRCPVCKEYFGDPVMLNCTHHICALHVSSLCNGSQHLTCPVCEDATVLPADGKLRVDKALQVVVDVHRERQQVPQQNGDASPLGTARQVCGVCEEKPATRHCEQCSGVLCEDCEKTMHAKGFFKSHTIVDITDRAAKGERDIWLSRMLCDDHKQEKLQFYCLDCRKSVCPHCLILGEHKGHQNTPIDQAFDTGKDTLNAWVEKLRQRITNTEDLLEQLHAAELEVQQGAEAQRSKINNELDHLRELIETKRQQLLSKSALEEQQKQRQLQVQVDRAEAVRGDSTALVSRSQDLLAVPSEHAFLAVVLPLIQDMKKCASKAIDSAPQVCPTFRPLSTDPQVRCLGDLDLGHPRPQHSQPLAGTVSGMVTQPSQGLVQQQVLGYGGAHGAISYVQPQPQPQPQQQQQQPQHRQQQKHLQQPQQQLGSPQQPQPQQPPQQQPVLGGGSVGQSVGPNVYVYRSKHNG